MNSYLLIIVNCLAMSTLDFLHYIHKCLANTAIKLKTVILILVITSFADKIVSLSSKEVHIHSLGTMSLFVDLNKTLFD